MHANPGLVFTTRHGTPIEPRNFNRSFGRCIAAARVPRITVHGTRETCASLLAARSKKGRFRAWDWPLTWANLSGFEPVST
jgi:integrase